MIERIFEIDGLRRRVVFYVMTDLTTFQKLSNLVIHESVLKYENDFLIDSRLRYLLQEINSCRIFL
jgi:hypothetical protein